MDMTFVHLDTNSTDGSSDTNDRIILNGTDGSSSNGDGTINEKSTEGFVLEEVRTNDGDDSEFICLENGTQETSKSKLILNGSDGSSTSSTDNCSC